MSTTTPTPISAPWVPQRRDGDSSSPPSTGTTQTATQMATQNSVPGPQLPNGTIVALGLGFVAAALFVICVTILARIHQVRLATRAAQARGEAVRFADVWDQMGGWFGLMGDGGAPDTPHGIRVKRLRRPQMWQVGLKSGDLEADNDEEIKPLSVIPSPCPNNQDRIAVSTLILMPSPRLDDLFPHHASEQHWSEFAGEPSNSSSSKSPAEPSADIYNYDHDEELDLPELVIGTAHFSPSAPLASAHISVGRTLDASDIVQIEYVPQSQSDLTSPFHFRSGAPPTFPEMLMFYGHAHERARILAQTDVRTLGPSSHTPAQSTPGQAEAPGSPRPRRGSLASRRDSLVHAWNTHVRGHVAAGEDLGRQPERGPVGGREGVLEQGERVQERVTVQEQELGQDQEPERRPGERTSSAPELDEEPREDPREGEVGEVQGSEGQEHSPR